MGEDHGAPEAGQLPRAWASGRRKTLSKRRRVRTWTMWNEMRGLPARMTAGAARRILGSANSMERRV